MLMLRYFIYQAEDNTHWRHIRDGAEPEPPEHATGPEGQPAVVAHCEIPVRHCSVALRSAERYKDDSALSLDQKLRKTKGKNEFTVYIINEITGERHYANNFYNFDEAVQLIRILNQLSCEKAVLFIKKK